MPHSVPVDTPCTRGHTHHNSKHNNLYQLKKKFLFSGPPSPTTISMLSINPFNEEGRLSPFGYPSSPDGTSDSMSTDQRSSRRSITPLAQFSRSVRESFPLAQMETGRCDILERSRVSHLFVEEVKDTTELDSQSLHPKPQCHQEESEKNQPYYEMDSPHNSENCNKLLSVNSALLHNTSSVCGSCDKAKSSDKHSRLPSSTIEQAKELITPDAGLFLKKSRSTAHASLEVLSSMLLECSKFPSCPNIASGTYFPDYDLCLTDVPSTFNKVNDKMQCPLIPHHIVPADTSSDEEYVCPITHQTSISQSFDYRNGSSPHISSINDSPTPDLTKLSTGSPIMSPQNERCPQSSPPSCPPLYGRRGLDCPRIVIELSSSNSSSECSTDSELSVLTTQSALPCAEVSMRYSKLTGPKDSPDDWLAQGLTRGFVFPCIVFLFSHARLCIPI